MSTPSEGRKLTTESPKKRALVHNDGPRKRRRRVKGDEDGNLDVKAGLNKVFERMDSQLLADYVAQKTNRSGTDLSAIELADFSISANAIKVTTSWAKPRSLDNLTEFLEKFSEDSKPLSEGTGKKGSPHTLIIAPAGLRAAELVRSVRKFQNKGNNVAKLFAKHMRIEEQMAFLGKTHTGIAIGTPQRLMDLLDNSGLSHYSNMFAIPADLLDALSIDSLKRVVVDASHIDVKKRGIMDMKETMMPLVKLLSRKELKEKFLAENQRVDLIFY